MDLKGSLSSHPCSHHRKESSPRGAGVAARASVVLAAAAVHTLGHKEQGGHREIVKHAFLPPSNLQELPVRVDVPLVVQACQERHASFL